MEPKINQNPQHTQEQAAQNNQTKVNTNTNVSSSNRSKKPLPTISPALL